MAAQDVAAPALLADLRVGSCRSSPSERVAAAAARLDRTALARFARLVAAIFVFFFLIKQNVGPT